MPAGSHYGETTQPFSGPDQADHPRGLTARQLSRVRMLWLCAVLSICAGCSKERFKAATDAVREEHGEKWHVVEGPDVVFFKLHAKTSIETLHGKTTAVLIISCTQGPDSVLIQAPAPKTGDVRIAFDDALPVKQQWGMKADDEILFPWTAERPSFLAQMLKAKNFGFEYVSVGEPAQSSTFDLLDIADLMAKDKRCAAPPQVPKRKK
jgi:hypothetical protein